MAVGSELARSERCPFLAPVRAFLSLPAVRFKASALVSAFRESQLLSSRPHAVYTLGASLPQCAHGHARLGVLSTPRNANSRRIHALSDYAVKRTGKGWYLGRTSRFGDMRAMKGPYSSERSVALMIAKRDAQTRLPG